MSRTWRHHPDHEPIDSVKCYIETQLPIGLNEFVSRFNGLGVAVDVLESAGELRLSRGKYTASYFPSDGRYIVRKHGRQRHRDATLASNFSERRRNRVSFEKFIDRFLQSNRLSFGDLLLHFDNEKQVEEAPERVSTVLLDVNQELLRYLALHPDYLHDLSSRKFEELIADIMKDFGFDVELTKATRDGGKDILAYLRNAVTEMLLFIECKKYAPANKVGVDVVRQVYGVQRIYKANKSLIVTTSSFTAAAVAERKMIESEMDLKDYDEVVRWLSRYQQPTIASFLP